MQEHQRKVVENQIYDKFEKKYIITEKLRKELGEDYESSGSDDDMDGQYQGLSLFQLKALTRKKLIEAKYNQDLLSELKVPETMKDNTEEQEPDSSSDFEEEDDGRELNVIN